MTSANIRIIEHPCSVLYSEYPHSSASEMSLLRVEREKEGGKGEGEMEWREGPTGNTQGLQFEVIAMVDDEAAKLVYFPQLFQLPLKVL